MGKETKIGLAILGVLLVAFGVLLFQRLTRKEPGNEAQLEAAATVAPQPTTAAPDRPTVVTAERDPTSGGPAANPWARQDRTPTEGASDVPRASFMPRETLEQEIPDRYNTPTELPAADESSAEPRAGGNQFRTAEVTPTAAEQEASADDVEDAPRRLDERAGDATVLEPTPARPPAANPLRRTSAEIPVDEQPAIELAAPRANNLYADDANDRQPDEQPPLDSPQDETTDGPPQDEEPLDRASISNAFDRQAQAPRASRVVTPQQGQPRYRDNAPRYREVQPASGTVEVPPDGRYVIQPNDTLYLISEKVYGTNGYFKALAEHNRNMLPHSHSLTVGKVIQVPPVSLLEQNYPSLCPKQRKSALVKSRTMPASTRGRTVGGNAYIVQEGDTLFDIARYELGKSSRWAEIYELNRDLLGEDFDYLQPGIELAMPAKPQQDSVTRGRDPGIQR